MTALRERGTYRRQRPFIRIIYSAFDSGPVVKNEMFDSCWTIFCAFGITSTVQSAPKRCAKTECIYDRALFIDDNKYERWKYCLVEFVRSVKC